MDNRYKDGMISKISKELEGNYFRKIIYMIDHSKKKIRAPSGNEG
jgi:hypothetical protein